MRARIAVLSVSVFLGAAAGFAQNTRQGGPAIPQLVRIRLTFAKGDARHWPDMIVAPQLWSPAL